MSEGRPPGCSHRLGGPAGHGPRGLHQGCLRTGLPRKAKTGGVRLVLPPGPRAAAARGWLLALEPRGRRDRQRRRGRAQRVQGRPGGGAERRPGCRRGRGGAAAAPGASAEAGGGGLHAPPGPRAARRLPGPGLHRRRGRGRLGALAAAGQGPRRGAGGAPGAMSIKWLLSA